jgi:hypothetical protein
MSIFNFLFGDKNPPPVETTNITTQEIPKYIAEPTAQIIGSAMDVAREGFVPYGGARLANFTQDELASMQGIRDMQGIAGLRGSQAFTAATAAGAPASSLMAPYETDYMTKVADIAAGKMRDQSAIEQQNIAAKAVGAGGLDNTRFAVLEAERQKNLQEGLGDLYTKAQASAFTTALGAAQKDKEAQLKSANVMGRTALGAQAGELQDIQALSGIGGLQRQMGQSALDIGYADFLQEQQYPKEQLGFVSNIIRGMPFGGKTTTVGQVPAARPAPFLSQVLGAGMQGANIYGSLFQPMKAPFG